jgi:hypothetical protein
VLSHHLPGHEEGAHTGIFAMKKAFSSLVTTKISRKIKYQQFLKKTFYFFVKIQQFYQVTCKVKYIEEKLQAQFRGTKFR